MHFVAVESLWRARNSCPIPLLLTQLIMTFLLCWLTVSLLFSYLPLSLLRWCCAAAAEFKQQNVAQALKVTFDTLPTQICTYVCVCVRLSKLRVSLLMCVRVSVCLCALLSHSLSKERFLPLPLLWLAICLFGPSTISYCIITGIKAQLAGWLRVCECIRQ